MSRAVDDATRRHCRVGERARTAAFHGRRETPHSRGAAFSRRATRLIGREPCCNCVPTANAATPTFPVIPPTRGSAPLNARSARAAARSRCKDAVPTAEESCCAARAARRRSCSSTRHPHSACTNPKAVVSALPDTALICRVPEAERYIAHYRERYDPPARRNVPAHVTVLYPFMPPGDIDDG